MPLPIKKSLYAFLLIAGQFASLPALAGGLLVVVGSNSTVPALDKTQVRNIFLGKMSSFPGGLTAIPVDQPEASPLREEFYQKVTNFSVAEAKARWAQLAFTGRGEPPRVVNDSNEIKRILNSTPGAIGYIEKSDLDASVRVVFTVE